MTTTIPTLNDFAMDSLGKLASAAMNFNSLSNILVAIEALVEVNPTEAIKLARTGSYLAKCGESEVIAYENVIEELQELLPEEKEVTA